MSPRKSGTTGRNKARGAQRPRCVIASHQFPSRRTGGQKDFFKGTTKRNPNGFRPGCFKSGVDFWHAVEFSRNGRFLWCRFTGALRASLRVSDSIRRFRVRFPVSGSTADPALCCFSVSAFRLSRCTRLYQKVSVGFPGQFESALETHVSAALVEAVVTTYWSGAPGCKSVAPPR
jgi:hypothetical protein